MNWIESLHGRRFAARRATVLASRLAEIMPPGAEVLDVGCGDGEIAWRLGSLRPDLEVSGVDVLVRPDSRIPIRQFDGRTLPFPANAFDTVTLIDVLHHCERPIDMLREATRVAARQVVIKDHLLTGFGAQATLRFMDRVGNRRYGVALPYNYLRPDEWVAAFADAGLSEVCRIEKLGLYPGPLSLVFERRLHFIAQLAKAPTSAAGDKAARNASPDIALVPTMAGA